MIDQLKRYWIALLVIVLVALHGAIVVMIRQEAATAKQNTSCEVDLGTYYVVGAELAGPLQMRIHSLSPVGHRLQSRRMIQLNEFQIREAIEVFLRQTPQSLMADPVLTDLKQQLLDIMIQTVGKSAVEDVLITDLRPVDPKGQWAFGTASHKTAPKMVITRREEHTVLEEEAKAQIAAEAKADSHGGHGGGHGDEHGGDHGDAHADAHGDSHGDSHGDAHVEEGHGESHASSHDEEASSHDAPHVSDAHADDAHGHH